MNSELRLIFPFAPGRSQTCAGSCGAGMICGVPGDAVLPGDYALHRNRGRVLVRANWMLGVLGKWVLFGGYLIGSVGQCFF